MKFINENSFITRTGFNPDGMLKESHFDKFFGPLRAERIERERLKQERLERKCEKRHAKKARKRERAEQERIEKERLERLERERIEKECRSNSRLETISI